jgi:hypothetical protein
MSAMPGIMGHVSNLSCLASDDRRIMNQDEARNKVRENLSQNKLDILAHAYNSSYPRERRRILVEDQHRQKCKALFVKKN